MKLGETSSFILRAKTHDRLGDHQLAFSGLITVHKADEIKHEKSQSSKRSNLINHNAIQKKNQQLSSVSACKQKEEAEEVPGSKTPSGFRDANFTIPSSREPLKTYRLFAFLVNVFRKRVHVGLF